MKFAEYLPFYKRNLLLAFPVMISQAGQVTVYLVDNMMVGHVGTVELAAASFANNVLNVVMYFGMGLTFGLTPTIGQVHTNRRKTTELLKNGVVTYFFSSLILLLALIGLYFLLPYFGQPDEVVRLAKPYYLWLCASFVPFMAFYTFKQFLEGLGNTKIAMAITIIANAINVIVNYVFIFGKFGFPELGLVGAGIGTFAARLAMPLLIVAIISHKKRFAGYLVLASRIKTDWSKIIKLLNIGVPIGAQVVVELAAFSLGAIMMGWMGAAPLAAHQVAIGLASLTYMISLGISSASTIRVSHQLGQHDYLSLKRAAYASTHLVLFFMATMAVFFIIFKDYLPYIFTTDKEVVAIASSLLVVAAFFQVFDGLQVVMLGALRGIADVKVPMFMAAFAYLLIGLPTSYVMSYVFDAGPAGIWYGFLIGLASAGLLFYFRFRRWLSKRV